MSPCTGKDSRTNIKLEYSFVPERTDTGRSTARIGSGPWAPRVTVKGMLRSGEGSRGVMILGIDPDAGKEASSKIYDYTSEKEGRYLCGPPRTSILISKSLAEKLDVYLGDRVVLMFQDRNNEIVGAGLPRRRFFRDRRWAVSTKAWCSWGSTAPASSPGWAAPFPR